MWLPDRPADEQSTKDVRPIPASQRRDPSRAPARTSSQMKANLLAVAMLIIALAVGFLWWQAAHAESAKAAWCGAHQDLIQATLNVYGDHSDVAWSEACDVLYAAQGGR